MVKSSAASVKLKSYDDLFGSKDVVIYDPECENVQELPISELLPFRNHPFKVVDDAAMQSMVESIKEYGVLTPVIVRPQDDGGYETIAGHRRKRGCELAGLDTIPAIVRQISDDEATILMVDTNIQRESILPSERAFAYKMKLDAMKHQGSRVDLTSSQVGTRLPRADEALADQTGTSRNQIHRFIRLTDLLPELLEMVDIKKVALNGVDFAVKKVRGETPLKYLVFFKARDADALMAAFKEYTTRKVKTKRPSALAQLHKMKALVKSKSAERVKNKAKERTR